MPVMFRPRVWFLLVLLFCASVLGFALYVQHVEFLDPCPLCVLQRIAFIWIGAIALVAVIHDPGMKGRWSYAALVALGAIAGSLVAGRHIWLQSLPPGQVPDCGMSLNYMIESLPFTEVVTTLFYGSGECAKVDWTLAGLSMPWWTLFSYVAISAATLLVVSRSRGK